jgi:hypothetical protein
MTLPSGHYLRLTYLNQLVETYRAVYSQAKPFPHLVIDKFLPDDVLDRVLNEFPETTLFSWQSTDGLIASAPPRPNVQIGETTYKLLLELNSPAFIAFLEQLTAIDGIMADPAFMDNQLNDQLSLDPLDKQANHQSCDRSLKVPHSTTFPPRAVEPPRYAQPHLDRKLNLLIYLNKDWKEEYGGHLELWNADMTRCEKQILPIFNRCVIFSTTEFSYHGHPEPLNCPDGESRKLLVLSYWGCASDRPATLTASVKAGNRPPLPRLIPRLIPEEPRKLKNNELEFQTNPASRH